MGTIRAKLTHMGIHVRDLDAMVRFYTEVLGLIVADRGPGRTPGTELVFMTADPACHHQVVLVTGRPDTSGFNPINQVSFTVDSLAARAGAGAWREQHAHGQPRQCLVDLFSRS